MTRKIINGYFVLFLLLISINKMTYAQETQASVQVVSRSLENKVLLRWAVDQPYEWKKANDLGFLIERATISRNGEPVVPIERQLLVSAPLKVQPQQEWEGPANEDQNIAVIAQALFGESFETTAPTQGSLGTIMAVNDELEQRFTFGLLAAEQSFAGALLAGWGFEDTNVRPGEKYVYTVSVALPLDSLLKIEEGTAFAGPDLFEELPTPIGLVGAFQDSKVTLSWNFNLLSSIYTNYFVERSEDGISFNKMNNVPIFNATQSEDREENSLFYVDSIPNDITYHYRVKGKSAFGEISPATPAIKGKAVKALGFVPRISLKEIPDDNTAILHWEFKEEGNALITGFELKRGDKSDGPFVTVQKDLPPSVRKTTFKGLKRINYFTVVAIGKNGIESPSFSTIVQPVDSIPPAAPKELSGVIDTTGVLTLKWAKNLEEDLGGYRIFKANNPNEEFSEVTNATYEGETFTDTVRIKNLNTKVYYKLQAEDQRYNRSTFSEMLTIALPDVTPPSPPVLKKYKVLENGIQLEWIPSSSLDVISHSIYRKNGTNTDELWQTVLETTSYKDTLFVDTQDLMPNSYSYVIVAKDSSGLESTPTNPITAIYKGQIITEEDIKFNGIVNRELRFINLTWRLKNIEVLEYRIFKSTSTSQLQLFKTFNSEALSFNDIDLEINSDYVYGIQVLSKGGHLSEIKKINLKY